MAAHTSSRWPWFLLANLALLLFFVIAFGREYIGNRQVEQEIARLEQEQSELTDDKAKTLELMQHLSSSYYLEEQARIKEGLVKPGETRIVLTDPTGTPGMPDSSLSSETISNPVRWFYYFFDRPSYEKLAAL